MSTLINMEGVIDIPATANIVNPHMVREVIVMEGVEVERWCEYAHVEDVHYMAVRENTPNVDEYGRALP